MANREEMERAFQAGVAAARAGDRARARQLFEALIALDPRHELAWLWLASVAATTDQRRTCLHKVLAINPDNARAQAALQHLGDGPPGVPRPRQAPRGRLRLPIKAGLGLLAGLALILGIALIAQLFGTQADQPPPTAIGGGLSTPRPTATSPPTATAFLVTSRNAATLPPTFTATATQTPSPTASPTATLYPLSDYALLAAFRGPEQTAPDLYAMRADGADLTLVLGAVADVNYDRRGQRVAFSRVVDYGPDAASPEAASITEIFVGPADDPATAQQVTRIRLRDAHSPTFSPSGDQLIFVSDFDGDDELWLYDLNTAITSQLTDNAASDRDPAWSPDGSQVVYSSDAGSPGLPELYLLIFDPDSQAGIEGLGYTIRRLTDAAGSSTQPTWLPDGSRIVYVNDGDGDADLFSIDPQGQRPRLLTRDTGTDDRYPVASPDGRYLAFISDREDGRFELYIMPMSDSQDVRRVTNSVESTIESFSFRPGRLEP